MNIGALTAGVAILVILAVAAMVVMAKSHGWRDTLCGIAFSLTVTLVITGAAFLISYGVGGFN